MTNPPTGNLPTLKQIPLFAELGPAELIELSRSLTRRRYNPDQLIFAQGEPGALLYLIDEGKVKIFVPAVEGQELVLAILGKGAFFGELALLDDAPRSAAALAIEPTTVFTLHRDAFTHQLHANPDIAVKMLAALARLIRHLNQQLSDVYFLDLPGRLARKLLQLADNHGTPQANGIAIEILLTQTDLAEMTGSTRVSINKALRRFRAEGWISYSHRRITIHNAPALHALTQMTDH